MIRSRNYLNRNFNKKRKEDRLSKTKRSALMSKIRSKDTKLEKNFISVLHKLTRKKFQTNVIALRGKPDLVFKKNKICVFLDSDFWHGWYYPRWKHLLKNDFWKEKIARNRRRDKLTTKYLKRKGWRVVRIWEHSIKNDPESCAIRIRAILR